MAEDSRKILSTDFINLKNKVKNEMNRRNKKGSAAGSVSVSSYAGTAYNYTVAPTKNGQIKGEHLKKIVEPMSAVNPNGLPDYPGGLTKDQMEGMETKIAVWAARNVYDKASSDCQAGCTGLCYSCTGSCSGTCSGCSGCSGCGGQCSNTCSGSCSGCDGCSGCGSGCSYGCSGTCLGTCRGSCSGVCQNDCGGQCTHWAYGTCGGCSGGCGGSGP